MKSKSKKYRLLALSSKVYSLHFEESQYINLTEAYYLLVHHLEKVEDVVLTSNRISLFFEEPIKQTEVEEQLSGIDFLGFRSKNEFRTWKLPICFDETFTNDLGIYFSNDESKIIAFRKAFLLNLYELSFYGFLPGFPYFSGLPKDLHLDRKEQPSKQIEKGTVAVGGGYVGIYPQSSPGGWQCIGNCPVPMITTGSSVPTFMKIGDKVSFYSISLKEYKEIALSVEMDVYKPNHISL